MSLALRLFLPPFSHAACEETVNRNIKPVKHMKNDKKNQTVKNANTTATAPNHKAVAIQMLKNLHAKLLKQGTTAIQSNPQKTNIIKAAMDNDLARINYTLNLLQVKM